MSWQEDHRHWSQEELADHVGELRERIAALERELAGARAEIARLKELLRQFQCAPVSTRTNIYGGEPNE